MRTARVKAPVCGIDVEIFRARARRACTEREFVLTALGIASRVVTVDGWAVLQVAAADVDRAAAQLREYERENTAAPARTEPALFPHAWVGCLGYAAWLLGVAYAVSHGLVRLDAFNRGELYGARLQQGQWWRAWTSLTLQASGPQLAGNLLAGLVFAYVASRQFGAGTAGLLIVLAAGWANVLQGLVGPPEYRSVGASTAVFAALGIIVAHAAWNGRRTPQSALRRWVPLGAGVVLLGWLGTSGRHTDLVAHALGFGMGVLFGWAGGWAATRRRLRRLPQWLTGLVAMLILAVAWSVALR